MRKRGYLIASLAMLLLLVLSGCKGNKLPDGMDEDKVSSAGLAVMSQLTKGEYEEVYDALREAGIGQGDTPAAILEPGCGTGNFMRLEAADLALDFHGVELDPISARIAQALFRSGIIEQYGTGTPPHQAILRRRGREVQLQADRQHHRHPIRPPERAGHE